MTWAKVRSIHENIFKKPGAWCDGYFESCWKHRFHAITFKEIHGDLKDLSGNVPSSLVYISDSFSDSAGTAAAVPYCPAVWT